MRKKKDSKQYEAIFNLKSTEHPIMDLLSVCMVGGGMGEWGSGGEEKIMG